jgi:hypothetical protein
MKKESFNIKYVITGREDGRWTIQAYDRKNKPLGCKVHANTINEIWEKWMILNGYSHLPPTAILRDMGIECPDDLESTQVIDTEKVA